MSLDLFKISRWSSAAIMPKCCDQKTDHWCIKVGPKTLCGCGERFTDDYYQYMYCNNKPSLYLSASSNYWYESSHRLCSRDMMLYYRTKCVIAETRELYNKLRLIEYDLTIDCVRYIVLAELAMV